MKFPDIFTWHGLNHLLELAVADVLKDVTAVKHFKYFIDSLYTLFSISNKNQRDFQEVSNQLGCQLLRIGRILDIRWVASKNGELLDSLKILNRNSWPEEPNIRYGENYVKPLTRRFRLYERKVVAEMDRIGRHKHFGRLEGTCNLAWA